MITLRFSTVEDSLVDFLIREKTWCDYSHVDLYLPGEGLLGAQLDGVKIRPFDYEPTAKFCYLATDVYTPDEEKRIIDWLRDQCGRPYDIKAIIGNLLHADWNNKHSFDCSMLQLESTLRIGKPYLNISHIDRCTPRDLMACPYFHPVLCGKLDDVKPRSPLILDVSNRG